MDLDLPAHFREPDPDGMLTRIGELPQTCRAAWALAQEVDLPTAYSAAQHVVVLGMGGSAIGGALLLRWRAQKGHGLSSAGSASIMDTAVELATRETR